jgi:hypothetical protein
MMCVLYYRAIKESVFYGTCHITIMPIDGIRGGLP